VNQPTSANYDVVVIGGALAGSATAFILLREQPKLRILILEKSTKLGRRVGEATIEISTFFLCRVLGLTQYLTEHHLPKQGLRFWFANKETQEMDECSEVGGKYLSRVGSFLVDRETLDSEVQRRAVALGAELWRPATVQKVELNSGGNQKLTVKYQDRTEEISARWVVDGSGVAQVLARQNGWRIPNLEHPTTAVWSRWRGVKDWESLDLAKRFPEYALACHSYRGSATNHLTGDGWWSWWIALKGGDMSIGVVFDQRLVKWPEGGSLGQRLKDFLMEKHPVAKELLVDAEWTEGDMHWRKNLPYSSSRYAGDGFVLVGDAGAFMDPFYSPGLDWLSFTTYSSAQLILAQQRGEAMAPLVERHNRDFVTSHNRWFRAIYKDKYEYMAEYDLFRLAFVMDIGLYYIGVACQPFRRGAKALQEPYYSTKPSTPFYHFMATYNRRFAQIARARRARGALGRTNKGRRFLFPGFNFTLIGTRHVFRSIAIWMWLEITEGWRSWFEKYPYPQQPPRPDPATGKSTPPREQMAPAAVAASEPVTAPARS
jgi:flavin-dependent dehydrogenase